MNRQQPPTSDAARWLIILAVIVVLVVAATIAAVVLNRRTDTPIASTTSSVVRERSVDVAPAPPSVPVIAVDADEIRNLTIPPPRSSRPLKIFDYRFFTVGYDEERRAGAWGRYELDGPITHPESQPKRPSFRTESRSSAKVSTKDFTNPGNLFERGHIVPSYAMWSRFGDEARVATFVMTNVFPQDEDLNGRIWEDIEDDIAGQSKGGMVSDEGYAGRLRHITVISGPVHGAASRKLPSGIPIPDAAFTIIYDFDETAGKVRARAYLVPNQAKLPSPSSRYASTIRDIELAPGLDFMPDGGPMAEALEVAAPVAAPW